MVDVDKSVIARYKTQGKNFEILVDCDKALAYREGKIKDTTQAIKNLKTIYPEDSEFESMFLKM